MRKIVIAALVAASLVACIGEGSLEKQIRNATRDPDATQFMDKITYKNWACISVNAKNGFGGYDGFRRYTMRNSYQDEWKQISTKDACTVETLKAAEGREVQDREAGREAENQVLKIMKEKKLVPPDTLDTLLIDDPVCTDAARSASTAGRFAVTDPIPTMRAGYKREFEMRLEALRGGTCAPPEEFSNALGR